MLRRPVKILLVAAFSAFSLIGLGSWLLPRAIAAIPGPYQQRLPQGLLQLVITPLPTALPAPDASVSQAGVAIPTIILPVATRWQETPTASPTPTPTSTAILTAVSSLTSPVNVSPTATPSPTLMSTMTPAPTLTPTELPLPAAARLEGLVNVPQKFNNCGPSNLSIALTYFGFEAHQLDIAAILRPNYDDRNVSPGELVQYVDEHTPLRATFHSGGDLETLKRLIASGFPVIIEKGLVPSEREGWMGHYLTLFAYDDAAQEFESLDTFLGPWDGGGRAQSYEEVRRQWGHFNYTFLVVYPTEVESEVTMLLGPTFLDPFDMWQAAALKANAELESDNGNAFAWFNLGTSLTHLGQLTGQTLFYRNAAAVYDRAREIGLPARMLWYQFEPYIAYLEVGRFDDVLDLTSASMIGGGRDVEEAHLYRGHALKALGDDVGARAAYHMALQLNPNFLAAQEALN